MAFAILRATNLCLRGSRKKWRSVTDMDNGAGLPFCDDKTLSGVLISGKDWSTRVNAQSILVRSYPQSCKQKLNCIILCPSYCLHSAFIIIMILIIIE